MLRGSPACPVNDDDPSARPLPWRKPAQRSGVPCGCLVLPLRCESYCYCCFALPSHAIRTCNWQEKIAKVSPSLCLVKISRQHPLVSGDSASHSAEKKHTSAGSAQVQAEPQQHDHTSLPKSRMTLAQIMPVWPRVVSPSPSCAGSALLASGLSLAE